MARVIHPSDPLPAKYRGLPELFEFTNWDGRQTRFNCGQAAACTFLSHHGFLKPDAEVMPEIERIHPPDNLGGWLGTSRRCVERICRAFDVKLENIVGENELRWHLGNGRPVIVMLGVPGRKFLGWTLPAGHWMVAYGFDHESIYLSNQGRMSWDDFRAGWRSVIPWLIGMRNRGLVLKGAPVTLSPRHAKVDQTR